MIGKQPKQLQTTGHYNSDTSLDQDYKSTHVNMVNIDSYGLLIRTEDNKVTDTLKVVFLLREGAPQCGKDEPIGPSENFNVTVFFPVPGGFHRIDTADRGEVTYNFDSATEAFEASVDFDVDGRGAIPGYTFSNGKIQVAGFDPEPSSACK